MANTLSIAAFVVSVLAAVFTWWQGRSAYMTLQLQRATWLQESKEYILKAQSIEPMGGGTIIRLVTANPGGLRWATVAVNTQEGRPPTALLARTTTDQPSKKVTLDRMEFGKPVELWVAYIGPAREVGVLELLCICAVDRRTKVPVLLECRLPHETA